MYPNALLKDSVKHFIFVRLNFCESGAHGNSRALNYCELGTVDPLLNFRKHLNFAGYTDS